MNLWEMENRLAQQGVKSICGCDEAGAGPLVGPVYAAAVILPQGLVIDGLNDSKKLTEKKRDKLFDIIIDKAESFAVASVSAAEIDEIDILNARMKAMRLAHDALSQKPEFVLIDGNCDRFFDMPHETVIGGDGLSANIAAASILAKVSRDRYMIELDAVYPGYGFAKHKGYGTKQHYAALDELGECPEHRKTFLRKYYAKKDR